MNTSKNFLRHPANFSHQYGNRQKGVGLIEVLISLLIASIGLLAVAAALGFGLKNNQASSQHSAAVNQGYAIMQELRSDKPNAIIGRYNLSQWTCSNVASDNPIGEMQNVWLQNIRSEISTTACGKINCSGSGCVIQIKWSDHGQQNSSPSSHEKIYRTESRL